MRLILRDLEWIFPFRTCQRVIKEGKVHNRACLNLQLGKCPGPCVGKISKPDYQKQISRISKYVLGKNDEIIRELRQEMNEYSENLEFEKAAKVRDKIKFIENYQKKQVVKFSDFQDRDIIAYYQEDKYIAVTVLKMQDGKINGKEVFSFKNVAGESIEAILRSFLIQYYVGEQGEVGVENVYEFNNLPHQILIQTEPEDYSALNNLFKKKIIVPARGEYKKLIDIARKNAFDYVESLKLAHIRKSARTIISIQELKDHLNLKKLPRKMVCIDISTIHGSETVSSLVFFENGKPLKKHYRHFIINTVDGQDDNASIAETTQRYIKNLLKDDGWEMPDLIIVDGGKGQLSSAAHVLYESQQNHEILKNIEIVSLAKRIEEVFIISPNADFISIVIPKTSPALKILTNIRDEAHRFAITHHRKRRDNRTLTSDLDKIKGLSDDNKFSLLKLFGSVENIKKADKNDLMKIKGIGEKLAELIMQVLNSHSS
jgi:excinuclease ABC subunit C